MGGISDAERMPVIPFDDCCLRVTRGVGMRKKEKEKGDILGREANNQKLAFGLQRVRELVSS